MAQGLKTRRSLRTRFIVSSRFQLKFIILMLLCMLFTVTVCVFTVYFTGVSTIVDKLSSIYPQGRLVALVNKVNLSIVINTMLLLPVVALIAVYLSHRVAGPIYRIERYLTDMIKGKLTTHIELRKNDERELKKLARKINDLTESMRLTILNERGSVDNVMKEVEEIKKRLADGSTVDRSDVEKRIDKIGEEMNTITRELGRFDT